MAGNKLTIGNVEITSLTDGLLAFDLCNFFPSLLIGSGSAHFRRSWGTDDRIQSMEPDPSEASRRTNPERSQ